MNVESRPCIHKDLKDIVIIVRSMDIELLSADPKSCDNQIGKQRWGTMATFITRIIIQDTIFIIVKNIDMFLRIILEHTLEVTTKDGWVKPHVLVVQRLVT